MPPDGYTSLTVSDEVFEQLVTVMAEYDCDSIADAGPRRRSHLNETKPNWHRSSPISWQNNPG
jgi:hypothetical protein